MGGEIVLLDEQHGQAATGRVARDARSVDSTAHDEQIVSAALRHLPNPLQMRCAYRRNKSKLSMFVFEIYRTYSKK